MRKSRFSEQQITGILREAEAGRAVKSPCRDHGVSRETFFRWRQKFGGLDELCVASPGTPSWCSNSSWRGCAA